MIMKTIKIRVGGMSCQHCVKAVTQAIQMLPGVSGVKVDLVSGSAVIDFSEDAFVLENVRAAVVDEGYDYQGQFD
jgi:copper chaperone